MLSTKDILLSAKQQFLEFFSVCLCAASPERLNRFGWGFCNVISLRGEIKSEASRKEHFKCLCFDND